MHAVSDARCVFDMGVSDSKPLPLYDYMHHVNMSYRFLFVCRLTLSFPLTPTGGVGFPHDHVRHWRGLQWF